LLFWVEWLSYYPLKLLHMWFAASEVSTGYHDGNGKRSARRVEGLKVQKVYLSRGQLLARIIWTPRPIMKEDTSLRYTVALWSGQCQDPDVTTLQPRSQLAATTEVCFDAVVTFENLYSVILWTSQSWKFNFCSRPLTHVVLSEKLKCFMLCAWKRMEKITDAILYTNCAHLFCYSDTWHSSSKIQRANTIDTEVHHWTYPNVVLSTFQPQNLFPYDYFTQTFSCQNLYVIFVSFVCS
jgi:hypothetical protein